MAVPYILPADLIRLPLGISLKTLGQTSTTTQPSSAQNDAEMLEVCNTATGMADAELNQSVRSSYVSEELYAPSHWASVLSNGMGRLLTSFNPVTFVPFMAVAYSGAPYPKQWTILPSGAAWAERQPTGVYGVSQPAPVAGGLNSILTSAQWVGFWNTGRYGQQLAFNYLHGWPHCKLVSAVAADVSSLPVDEVAGCTGAAMIIQDGASLETVLVQSVSVPTPPAYNAANSYFPGNMITLSGSVMQCQMANGPYTPSGPQAPTSGATGPYWSTLVIPSGPGTLNLVTPTQYAHQSVPVLVSSLPYPVRWGAALYAKAIVLERGLAVVGTPGSGGHPVSTAEAIEDATVKAVAALRPFARIV